MNIVMWYNLMQYSGIQKPKKFWKCTFDQALLILNVHKIPGENEAGSVYWFQQSQNHCNFAERKTLSDFHYRAELFALASQHSNHECLIRAIQHFCSSPWFTVERKGYENTT